MILCNEAAITYQVRPRMNTGTDSNELEYILYGAVLVCKLSIRTHQT